MAGDYHLKDSSTWVLEVNHELKRLSEITEAEISNWKLHSIYKLPARITRHHKDAYKPLTVSFGPYHYGDLDLKAMDAHKHRALLHFLRRSGKSLDCYLQRLRAVEKGLKDAYDCLDPTWDQDSDAFLQLMMRDGCFMLELLRSFDHQTMDDYAPNDPIFGSHGRLYIMDHIRRDMLMLENQLPMLLLTELLSDEDKPKRGKGEYSINRLIQRFLILPFGCYEDVVECMHVLDVYRKSLLIRKADLKLKIREPAIFTDGDFLIPSATGLSEAGIRIKANKTGSLKDISFSFGTLRLPRIVLHDASESEFLNLIAMETLHVGVGNEVSSYIGFMANMIEDPKDVCLLRDCGIILDSLGNDQEVVRLFGSLGKDITYDPDCRTLNELAKANYYCKRRVNQYLKRPLNRWRAILVSTYFRNPWSMISLVAAILLFGLTILQTIYTVSQSYQQRL